MESMVALMKDERSEKIRFGSSLAESLRSHQTIQNMIPKSEQISASRDREWYWTNWQTEEATRVMTFPFVCAMDNAHHIDYPSIYNTS